MEKNRKLNSLRMQEKEARRNLIIDAAERIFAEKPFDRVSVRDIAREAGISHALIYRHFPDQQSLFVEAFLRGAEKIIRFLGELIDEKKTVSIEKVTERFISYLIENDSYFRMMTHFMLDGSLGAGLIERLNTAERALLDQLDRLFIRLKAKGDVRMLSHAYFAAMNGVLITFRNYPGRSGGEVKRHMIRIGKIIAQRFRV